MKANRKITLEKSGFTLIELLVVIAIIATLATLGFVGGKGAIERGHKTESLQHLTDIVGAMEAFYADNSTFPSGFATNGSIDVGTDSGSQLNGAGGNATLIQALCGEEGNNPAVNLRSIRYLSANTATASTRGMKISSGIDYNSIVAGYAFVDYWGNPYYVNWDSDYDGVVNDPFSTNQLRKRVIAMGRGTDYNNALSASSPQTQIVKTW